VAFAVLGERFARLIGRRGLYYVAKIRYFEE
jgi:hypothetical protein